jgi:hypothetical protein
MGGLKQQLLNLNNQKKTDQLQHDLDYVKAENDNLKNKLLKKEFTTINQQLLMLHYMGVLDDDKFKFQSKEKKYEFFHLLIDKNQQAVKDFIHYRNKPDHFKFSKIFNEDDLYKVKEYFEQFELNELAKKVDLDIIKLKF